MIGIYRIRNILNNKCYYGSAKNIKRRWYRHKSGLKNNRHENIHLQRAWNKYGKNNFIFEIVELCQENELLNVEQKYLNKKNIYNIGKKSSGGDNITNHPNKNKIREQIKESINKTIAKLSKEERQEKWGRTGNNNPNWKNGISVKYCKCGKEITPQNNTCRKCRPMDGKNNSFFNKHHTDKTKKILSEKRKGTYYGVQNIKFTIDGIEYFSLGDACNKLNIPIPTILWRLKSKNKKFENYKYMNK